MENDLYSTTIDTTPLEMLNIIERELSEIIGKGCSQMFIQSIYDEVVAHGEQLTQEKVSKIYRELHVELKGLLGAQGLKTLNRRVTNALMERWGLNLLEMSES
ncbi:MAG: hypothetical protein JSV49_02950 [Thermoplasmata archaeon]|nr:MAG: hypothetical protein JSV49_02950 [Thermoplasmata archaeon]